MTKLVVFTGIDGAGKTTQAKLLRDSLCDEGINAKYEQLMGPNFRMTKVIKDRFGEQFLDYEDEAQLSNSDSSSSAFKPMGLFFLYRGLWQSWINILINRDADIIVLDRYLFDDLVRVHWKYSYSLSWISKVAHLAPTPEFVVYLDAKPEIAWKREDDGRTSIDQHRQKRSCVRRVSDRVLDKECVLKLDTSNLSVDQSHAQIQSAVNNHILNK